MEDGTQTSLRNICDTDAAVDTRRILDLVGDKWSLLVVSALEHGTRRFSELMRSIGPISQRMLTRTLRQLERNGLVERTIYPTIPPRVDYTLTALGGTLLDAVRPLLDWTIQNRDRILRGIQHARGGDARPRAVRHTTRRERESLNIMSFSGRIEVFPEP